MRLALLLVLVPAPSWGADSTHAQPVERLLARVEVVGSLTEIGLPIHAHFVAPAGIEYVIVAATATELRALGTRAVVLGSAQRISQYVLVQGAAPELLESASGIAPPLHRDARRLLLRADEILAGEIAEMGLTVRRLPERPMDLRVAPLPLGAAAWAWDPTIAGLVAAVDEAAVTDLVAELSGERETSIGGSPYTILTRHTASGEPLEKALDLVADRLRSWGLTVSEDRWSGGAPAERNVTGTLPGISRPGESVLVTAHLDNRPSGPRAPGADDNASGCAAVLTAAALMSGEGFQRTVRFVFFTGEEQGLLGSRRYAEAMRDAGDTVVAVLNLDMIGWNGDGAPIARLHARTPSHPSYPADAIIAATFAEVVDQYGLADQLAPVETADALDASDHASFWNVGYPAILIVEDDAGDFNPFYHTVNDTLASLDSGYMTTIVRATIGTAAVLAGPEGGAPLPQMLTVSLAGEGAGSVSSVPTGIDCPGTCQAVFPDGAAVELHAQPAPGSWLSAWEGGGCWGGGGCTVTMTAPHNVTASFSIERQPNPDTPGVYQGELAHFALRNSSTYGWADARAIFGLPGSLPVTGDWDGDGTDTIGIFRNGVFFVRLSNSNGPADLWGAFGAPGDVPVAGDFNRDGADEVGVFRDGLFTLWLRDAGSTKFAYGLPGDIPLAGDWTGKGYDSVGIYRPATATFHLRNSNDTGFASIVVTFGQPGDVPVVGDWDGDGVDTVGFRRGSIFHLRNANSAGPPDLPPFLFGLPQDVPLAGDWDGRP